MEATKSERDFVTLVSERPEIVEHNNLKKLRTNAIAH